VIRSQIFFLIVAVTLNTGCLHFPPSGWEHRGDKTAQGVLAGLDLCAGLLPRTFEDINKCLQTKNINAQNSSLNVDGEFKIENGCLSLTDIHFKDVPELANNPEAKKCLESKIRAVKFNVANGLMYNKYLLTKDHEYVFTGSLAPKVSGEVRSVEYNESKKF